MEKSGKDRRRAKRVRMRLRVEYGIKDLEHRCFSRDVSVGGLFLLGEALHPSGTRIHLHVHTPEEHFYAEGLVAHAKRVPTALRQIEPQGMGVRLLGPAEVIQQAVPKAMRRVETLSVECQTPAELQRLLAEQLQAGVLLVPVVVPPPAINAMVEFEILLSFGDGQPIHGTGRLIQLLPAQEGNSPRAVLEVQDAVALRQRLEATLKA